jgi:hypothetical protein
MRTGPGSRLSTCVAVAALTGGLILSSPAFATDPAPTPAIAGPAVPASGRMPSGAAGADFAAAIPSADARQVADWVIRSGDNDGMPFAIVDKTAATLFLFAPDGVLRATTPVLLGLARGDDDAPGTGDRPLTRIAPAQRITPAGRFVAVLGVNLAGQDILWVDYAAAISVHRATDVKAGLTANERLARLASATTQDNRISHGCINVTSDFFDAIIRPTFSARGGIVYVLPETRSIRAEFPIPAEPVPVLAVAQAAGDSGRM